MKIFRNNNNNNNKMSDNNFLTVLFFFFTPQENVVAITFTLYSTIGTNKKYSQE